MEHIPIPSPKGLITVIKTYQSQLFPAALYPDLPNPF